MSERFWSKVKKTEDDSCWEWQGPLRGSNDYGAFYMGDYKTVQAHRYVWAITYGEIPAGMLVCHKCDNPKCVRPNHLFLGTPKDNMHDMIKKGRQIFDPGILTEEQVKNIRAYSRGGKTSTKLLAKRFGVSSTTINDAVNRKRYNHIPNDPNHVPKIPLEPEYHLPTLRSQCALTIEQVRDIRVLYFENVFNKKQLAEYFDVSESVISATISRKHYAHVPDPYKLPKRIEPLLQADCALTVEEVQEIRRIADLGLMTHRQLGKQFGVSKTTIGYVVRRVYYKQVP